MKDVNSGNFGLLIAYLIPGFIALFGVAHLSPTLSTWLSTTPVSGPTMSGFLFSTFAATGAGLVVNAVRWHLVDPIHYVTGVPRKTWDYPRLPNQVQAFQFLITNQFRYYECYANTMVSVAFAVGVWLTTSSVLTAEFCATILVIEFVLWSASRRTLSNYHRRIAAFLDHLDSRTANPTSLIDQKCEECYTDHQLIRCPRIIVPFTSWRRATAEIGIQNN